MLPIIDIVFLLFLAGFVFYGLFFGLIKTAGSLVGVVAGAFVASRLYLSLFELVASLSLGYENLGKILSFIICFTIVNRLVGLVFAILDRTFGLISIIPFLKTINRLAGAVLGFVEGGLIIGLFLYVIARYTHEASVLGQLLAKSQFAPFFVKFATVLTPLLPDLFKQLKSIL